MTGRTNAVVGGGGSVEFVTATLSGEYVIVFTGPDGATYLQIDSYTPAEYQVVKGTCMVVDAINIAVEGEAEELGGLGQYTAYSVTGDFTVRPTIIG